MLFLRSWAVLVAAVVFPCWGVAQAEEHRDAARHYTFQIPDGWTKLAPETLAVINAMGKVAFETGYQTTDQLPGEFPYFVVQSTATDLVGYSYEEVERGLARVNPIGIHKGKGALGGLVKNASITNFASESTKKRVTVRIELNMVDNLKVQGISYGMIGKEAIVWLHCYALEQDFERYLPVFNGVADSFRYDEGHEFVPGQRRRISAPALGFERLLGYGALAALIAVIALRHKLFRRSSSRSDATPEN